MSFVFQSKLQSSKNIGNSDLTISDTERSLSLSGSLSTNKYIIDNGASNLVTIQGDGAKMFENGIVDIYKQNGATNGVLRVHSSGNNTGVVDFYNSTGVKIFQFREASGGSLMYFLNSVGSLGLQLGGQFSSAIVFGEGKNITVGTTTGTKIGDSNNQLIGKWGSTPIAQPLEPNLALTPNSGDANTDLIIQALINVILNTGNARTS